MTSTPASSPVAGECLRAPLFSAGRAASQELLDRLAARGGDLHARVESGGRRVPSGPGDPSELSWATASLGVVQAYQLLRARIGMLAQGRVGGEEVWMRFDPGDASALRVLASCIDDAKRTVPALRDSPQPLASGWVSWLRARRDGLGELVGAACGPGGIGTPGDGGFGGACVNCRPLPRPGGASATQLLHGIRESSSDFGAACAELVSAQPGVAHGEFGVRASPLDPALLTSFARQRAAFCLSTTAVFGCPLLSFAHPGTALALLAAQRSAAAEALRRLADLRQLGTPGATDLTASPGAPTRDAILCDAVLASCISVVDQPGALAIGLFPCGSCVAGLVKGLWVIVGPAPGACFKNSLSGEARDELVTVQHAYPLSLGAVIRASFPDCSAMWFEGALANADRDCAVKIASIARRSVTRSPRVADLLGRLSSCPGAPHAVLATAVTTSRRNEAVAGGDVSAVAGIFPHGLALQQMVPAATPSLIPRTACRFPPRRAGFLTAPTSARCPMASACSARRAAPPVQFRARSMGARPACRPAQLSAPTWPPPPLLRELARARAARRPAPLAPGLG